MENAMATSCDRPIFGKGKGLVAIGHCALHVSHAGQCAMQVETKKQRDGDKQGEIDFSDLYDNWRPIRDIGNGEGPLFSIEDEI